MSTAATSSQPTTSSSSNNQASKLIQKSKETSTKSNDLTKTSLKDDETCDDWEQLDQIQIKKSLQSIKLSSEKNDEENLTNNTNNLNSVPFTFNMQNSNSSFPQPSIKILKRPPSDKKLNEMSQNQNGQTQPIKTFKQREIEYAEARLRILGSAHPTEEEEQATASNINIANNNTNNKVKSSNNNANKMNPNNNQFNNYNNYSQQPSYVNNNNANNMQYNNVTIQNQFENSYSRNLNTNAKQPMLNLNLIRDPIVPDGTRGFRGFDNEPGRNLNAKQ